MTLDALAGLSVSGWKPSAKPSGVRKVVALLCFVAASTSWAATFSFGFVDNAEGDFAARGWMAADSVFQRNFRKAGQLWGRRIASNAGYIVTVKADRTVRRAGGTFSYGRKVGTAADGADIWEPGPLTKARTGTNPGLQAYGYDMQLTLDARFADEWYWVNTDPENQSVPVPSGKTDLIWVLLHELGHALGVAGTWQPTTQQRGLYISSFDSYLAFAGNGAIADSQGAPNPAYFSGPETAMIAGEMARIAHVGTANTALVSQDFYHLGTCSDAAIYTQSLMNGCVTLNRPGDEITPIDVALLGDLGFPINSVYYGKLGELHGGIQLSGATDGTVYAVVLRLADVAQGVFELKSLTKSRRASSDGRYDSANGTLSLTCVIVGNSQYRVDMVPVAAPVPRWKIGVVASAVC